MNIEYLQDILQVKVIIAYELLNGIIAKALENHPNEFGGILLGKYDNENLTAIVTDVIYADHVDNTPVTFTRYPETLNTKISEIFSQTGGGTIYIGEWHSHPNMYPKYSITDYKAMLEITTDPQVAISNPLLLIIGGDKETPFVSLYGFFENELYEFTPNSK